MSNLQLLGNGMNYVSRAVIPMAVVGLMLGGTPVVKAQGGVGTAFMYQGRLTDNGVAATGVYDVEVALFDAANAGALVGVPQVSTHDDVQVTSGLFVIRLDFGAAAFTGQRRWLEIRVRPGGSVGAFSVLAPRHEVTPDPVALYSTVAATAQVATNAQSADTATTVAGLACSSGQVLKWSGTGWGCGSDVANAGSVTSVTAGAGLQGGVITATGTIAVAPAGIATAMIADEAITSAKIASGAVGASQVNTTQVQARIGAGCTAGSYIRAVAADGTPTCETLPQGLRVLDANGVVIGSYSQGLRLESASTVFREHALRAAGGTSLLLRVSPSGFVNSASVVFWHTEAGCAGTKYVTPEDSLNGTFPATFQQAAQVLANRAIYPAGSVLSAVALSNTQCGVGADPFTGAGCTCDTGVQPGFALTLKPAAFLDLSQFTAPFRVE